MWWMSAPLRIRLGMVLGSYVETNIEQFSSIEFSLIIGLFNDINVVIRNEPSLLELAKELMHMRNKFGQVLSAFLGGMKVSERDNDGDGSRIS